MKFRISETKSQRPLLMTIKWTIPLLFPSKWTTSFIRWRQRCGAHSEFLFCLLKLLPVLFSRFIRQRRASSGSLETLYLTLGMRGFRVEKPTIWWKNAWRKRCPQEPIERLNISGTERTTVPGREVSVSQKCPKRKVWHIVSYWSYLRRASWTLLKIHFVAQPWLCQNLP